MQRNSVRRRSGRPPLLNRRLQPARPTCQRLLRRRKYRMGAQQRRLCAAGSPRDGSALWTSRLPLPPPEGLWRVKQQR